MGGPCRVSVQTAVGDDGYVSVTISVVQSTVHEHETEHMSNFNRKSCVPADFLKYMSAQELYTSHAKSLYSHPYFRQDRFRAKCMRKSCEQKFVHKVRKTFGAPVLDEEVPVWMRGGRGDLTAVQQGRAKMLLDNARRNVPANAPICILYGMWRGANLKGSAPSPGVGLRRRLESKHHILTLDASEVWSSQTCPACGTVSMENVNLRQRFPGDERQVPHKHRLLRCNNNGCPCRWWERNVSGSLCIGLMALDQLLSRE
jgi:hypothetical protein